MESDASPSHALQVGSITSVPKPLVPKEITCSVKVCSANLVMSILGAGQLTLPHCLQQLGISFGVLSICAFAFSSMYSMMILASCANTIAASSYKELIAIMLGPGAKHLLNVLILFYIWGGSVAFFIIVKEELTILIMSLHMNVHGAVLLTIVVICVWPLCMIRRLDKLKFTSILGVLAAIWITSVVVCHTPWVDRGLDACAAAHDPDQFVKYWPTSFLDVAAALPLVAFAFNGSWSFPTVYHSLDHRTPLRTTAFILVSVSFLLINYFAISITGYLSYCNAVHVNIIDSLMSDTGWYAGLVMVARAALVSQLCLAMPVRCNVFASIVVPPSHITCRQHIVLSTVMLFTSAGVAMTPLQLDVAIGLTSAVCASFIMYILPAVCEAKLIHTVPTRTARLIRVFGAMFLGSLGFFVFAVGTFANVRTLLG